MKPNSIALFSALITLLLFPDILSAQQTFKSIDLQKLFDKGDKLWEITTDEFLNNDYRPSFKWQSKTEKNSARYPAYRNSPGMTFMGMKVWEAIVSFDNNKLSNLDISLYNRGDAGPLDAVSFRKILLDAEKKLNHWQGTKGKKHRRVKVAGAKIYTEVWVKDSIAVVLKWSYSGRKKSFKAEFINIDISKFDPRNDPRRKPPVTSKRTKVTQVKSLKDNIKKNDEGDVYIENVPMVNQGMKGYCAVAVTERVLRYYGQDIDQHQIAQLAQSSAGSGTNPQLMIKVLKRASTKFRVKVKTLYTSKIMASWSEFKRHINKYNRMAKKKNVPKFDPDNCIVNRMYNPMLFYQTADREVYKEFRCKSDKRHYKKFKEYIRENIDKGIPLLWGMFVGFVKENLSIPQIGISGHMRLIIGYNDQTDEIIYTDSWGAGHEFKKMRTGDAWTVTLGLYYLLPRKNR